MTIAALYEAFSPETQAGFEAWLVETYGAEMRGRIDAARDGKLAEGEMSDKLEALRDIEADLVAAYEAGVAPEAAELGAHRAWVAAMWGRPCTQEAYAGLAEIYLSHPDFIARYEALSPGFSQWLPAAMRGRT